MSRFDLSQHLAPRAEQQMQLSARMLQSIEVLALPAEELEAFLRDAFERNEALLLVDRTPPPPALRRTSGESDDGLHEHPARSPGAIERLQRELDLQDAAPAELAWSRLLVTCLDERGYLTLPDDELLRLGREQRLPGGPTELGRAIALLQRLEPRGIGARDLTEALLLQLDPSDADYPLACRLVEEFLHEVARNKLPQVARALGIELQHLNRLVAELRELVPAPLERLSGHVAPVCRPDVVVERDGAGFAVRVERSSLPALRIDASVRALARDRAQSADLRRYLNGKVDQARAVVRAVEQRRRTLLRVARGIFSRQGAFLQRGPAHLAPLLMTDLAADLELHTSTISRAVAGKWAQTPWGILPLRRFFQARGVHDAESTRDGAHELVRALIEAEDPARPLSDDEIVAEIARRGQRMARRTVAKYRAELGIPSSYRRRRY